MAAKPTKTSNRYESWRGTARHLTEIAGALKIEIERAEKAARDRVDREDDEFIAKFRTRVEQELRTKGNLRPSDPLPEPLQTQLAQEMLRAEEYGRQRRASNKDVIEGATKLVFGYSESSGRSPTSANPDFLATVSGPDGISMRGNVFASPTAWITVTIQNRPWEAISLEVEGEDPDWVSSAAAPLHALLTARESKVVRFFRNSWVKSVFGVLVWAAFIPPVALGVERLGLDRLIAVPVSALLAGMVGLLYQWLTRPVIITSATPSAWLELARVAIPVAVATLLRFGLDRLAQFIAAPK